MMTQARGDNLHSTPSSGRWTKAEREERREWKVLLEVVQSNFLPLLEHSQLVYTPGPLQSHCLDALSPGVCCWLLPFNWKSAETSSQRGLARPPLTLSPSTLTSITLYQIRLLWGLS